jgi:hypothetical protein
MNILPSKLAMRVRFPSPAPLLCQRVTVTEHSSIPTVCLKVTLINLLLATAVKTPSGECDTVVAGGFTLAA